MAFNKKTWLSRMSSYPNRRVLTPVAGTQDRYTITRDEGTITREGDAFSAANMNGLEDRIGNAFDAEHTFLVGVLHAGDTQIDFTDEINIVDGCMPHVYVPMEHSKLIYDSMSIVSDGVLRITFPAQTEDITIKVKIEHDQTPSL